MSYEDLLKRNPPIAIYDARKYDSGNQMIVDSGPYFNNGFVQGNQLQKGSETNGLQYVRGTTNNTIEFLSSRTIATKFTICSITKFVDQVAGSIIHSDHNDIYHGHSEGKAGIVYYGSSNNLTGNDKLDTKSWLVCCAKTGGNTPTNVYINGQPIGAAKSTQMYFNNKLFINGFMTNGITPSKNSNFAFSYMVVWDSELTDSELKIVSDELNNYLQKGTPPKDYNPPDINSELVTGTNLQFDQSKILDVIQHQEVISDAVDHEINRTSEKLSTIKYAKDGQSRSINININYRKRYAAYLQIFIACIIALIIYVFFASVDVMAYNLSPLFMNSLAFILIFLCIMYSIYVYFQILRRDSNNFDKLKLDSPNPKDYVPTTNPPASSIKHLGGSCENNECCYGGTVWNKDLGKCEQSQMNRSP